MSSNRRLQEPHKRIESGITKGMETKRINPRVKGFHYKNGEICCYQCNKRLFLTRCQVCFKYYSTTAGQDSFEKLMEKARGEYTSDDQCYPDLSCPGNHQWTENYLMCVKCNLYYSVSPCCSDLNLRKIVQRKESFKNVIDGLKSGKYRIQLSKFIGFNVPYLLNFHYITCCEEGKEVGKSSKNKIKTYQLPEFRPNKTELLPPNNFRTKDFLRYYQDIKKLKDRSVSYQHLSNIMLNKYVDETVYYDYLTYYQGDKEQLYTSLKSYFCRDKQKFYDLWKTDEFDSEMHWLCQRCKQFYHQTVNHEIIEKIDYNLGSQCFLIKRI